MNILPKVVKRAIMDLNWKSQKTLKIMLRKHMFTQIWNKGMSWETKEVKSQVLSNVGCIQGWFQAILRVVLKCWMLTLLVVCCRISWCVYVGGEGGLILRYTIGLEASCLPSLLWTSVLILFVLERCGVKVGLGGGWERRNKLGKISTIYCVTLYLRLSGLG